MKLRFIECYIPKHLFVGIDEIKKWDGVVWADVKTNNSISTIQILTTLKDSEKIVDKLKEEFGGANYRIVVFEPTMTYPPIEEKEDKEPERLIREELYNVVADIAKLNKDNIMMLLLSTIVAIAGIYRNDIVLLIASMIIAPLLSPHIALALSITVADYKLALKSIKTIVVELLIVIVISAIAGHYLPINLENPQIHSRITLDLWNVVIALSAGIAGSLSTITNISSSVVGVMIAIALLPPLVVFGLLIGAGYVGYSFSAFILFLINMIAINLSAVAIFSSYGVSPYRWWEKEKAKKYTIYAIILWLSLLVFVFVLIFTR
ncbi:uncharacterized hydrophobic domain protein [Methanocaldococcus vulcanius M7]|uniref:Uncharacterized hydrophobic domain protein n=1 Tax=Methanocaldococcus vulcanius (strain ATCC 700851 / DSM 12094 / M7) TaxID=579137 RepID=C9RHH7_METVM|nr:TIGR00341 family protein [Methanocaldococcus vulcanius]ACX73029.1 uncharacterized hydrophobic domain protein [Methanocaldococcus vulcanius M7]